MMFLFDNISLRPDCGARNEFVTKMLRPVKGQFVGLWGERTARFDGTLARALFDKTAAAVSNV